MREHGMISVMVTSKSSGPVKRPFVLGRARMEKISAVEGITTSPATRTLFAKLEHEGASREERRRAVLAAFANKA